MRQLEIEYFFPLTEQIALDLDFTPSEDYLFLKRNREGYSTVLGIASGTTLSLMANSGTITWSQRIGDWEIPSEKKQPSKLQKFLMKYFLGWKWMGK